MDFPDHDRSSERKNHQHDRLYQAGRETYPGRCAGEEAVTCRVCDSNKLELAIEFPDMPWANNFLTKEQLGHEKKYPLRVVHCADCRTAQLDHTVPKEIMFAEHSYRSGTTKSLAEHFQKICADVHINYHPERIMRQVLDIGSNDGTFLKCFKNSGWDVLGVEACKSAAIDAIKNDIQTIPVFFNEESAEKILSLYGKFDCINASGVFFHLEELHSVCEGIKLLLKDDGVFVVQFIYAKSMLDNGAFDQIYHEHLLYYTLETINVLLKRHGLEMFDAYLSPIHGGSIIGFVGHENERVATQRLFDLRLEEERSRCNELSAWRQFGSRIEVQKRRTLEKLFTWKHQGKKVYGMGAPVKGNTLLNTFGIREDLIECLTERNPLRDGLFAPGSHIPVVMEGDRPEPDVYFVLAWNFKKEILERYKDSKAEFFFPVDVE